MIPNSSIWHDGITHQEKEAWIHQNQHICIYPYNTFHIQIHEKLLEDVTTSCCCNLDLTDEKSVDFDFTDVKNSMLQGNNSKRCNKCYASEKQVGSSERTTGLINLQPLELNNFLSTNKTKSFEFRIKFSNLCNLACRTCAPQFSSKYAQAHNIIVDKRLQEDISYNEAIWHLITEQIKNKCLTTPLVCISILGGESLIQPGVLKLIDWLINNNLNSQVSLRFTTNFTNLNHKIISKFNMFNQTSICASIDSVSSNYNYIRWPGDFNDIEKNLELIVKSPNINFFITPVWSLNNIFYITDYLDFWHSWFTKNNINYIPIFNVSMSEPRAMTIQNLPVEYRPYLLDIVKIAYNHPIFQNPKHLTFQTYLKGIIDFLSTDEVIYDQFDEFLFETAKHDRVNQIPMSIGNKKFYDILSDQHRRILSK